MIAVAGLSQAMSASAWGNRPELVPDATSQIVPNTGKDVAAASWISKHRDGEAFIRSFQVPVWALVNHRRLGGSDDGFLRDHPQLNANDLDAAWAYANSHTAEMEKAIRDCLNPSVVTGVSADDLRRFEQLVAEWKAGRRMTGTAKKMADHPAYQKIIAMGPQVVPLILAELHRAPDHWFIALHDITKASPVPDAARGDLAKMTKAWVEWWEKEND